MERRKRTLWPGMKRARVAACAVIAVVAYARTLSAQEIKLEEVPSAEAVAPAQVKPRTVVFSDHKNDSLIDAGTGLMKFSEWARAKPIQKQVLALYPGYEEPTWKTSDGSGKIRKLRLHMYVAETRFIVSRPPASIDLTRYATLPFLEKIDPAIKSRTLAPADVALPK